MCLVCGYMFFRWFVLCVRSVFFDMMVLKMTLPDAVEKQLFSSSAVLQRREMMVVKLVLRIVDQNEIDPLEDRVRCLSPIVGMVKDVVRQYYSLYLPHGVVMDRRGEKNHFLLIYFPTIVRDDDPIYRVLIQSLIRILNHNNILKTGIYGEVKWDATNVMFENSPEAVDDFEEDMCDGCEYVSEDQLRVCRRMGVTPNIMSLVVDRFDMLLDHFIAIHKTEKDFFMKNIRYVCCAFYRQRRNTAYFERDERSVCIEDWFDIARRFDVSDAIASEYYNQINDYSYTVVTMEEILKRRGEEMRERINRYNSDRIRHMVKMLITQGHSPSHNELWKVFAEFIRRDHFYAEGSIYIFEENICMKREAKDLRLVANRFVNYLREGMLTLKVEALQSGETLDVKKTEGRISEMIKPFENASSLKFIENACSNYLDTRMRTAIRRSAVLFKDVVVVYDRGELSYRKAFMEDQFTSSTPVKALGFGHTDSHKQAIKEVKETLMKMFGHDTANTEWFIRWMGSLLVHRPERVCLVIHGPKGSNGKTTLMNVLSHILGDFATQCRPDILIANSKGGLSCTPFEMELKDKILAVISEPTHAQIYSSSALKEISGGDLKTGTRKYKDPETFQQTAKLVILSNAIPTFDIADIALCDRLYIILSSGRFVKNPNPDPEIQKKEQIYQEDMEFWSDIRKQALAYIMLHEGFAAYKKEGLKKTPSQLISLTKWQAGTNSFISFNELAKERHNNTAYLTDAIQVYEVYKQKNSRSASTLSYDKFKSEFKENTGYSPVKIGDTEYYTFYHPYCDKRYTKEDTE
jgi:hypothetical protein